MDGDLQHVAAVGAVWLEAPTGDAAEEVQTVRLEAADFHLHALWHGLRHGAAGAAFEHDDVRSARRLLRRDDAERDALDENRPGLPELERFILRRGALVKAARGVARERALEVEHAEFPAVHALHVGDDVAQGLAAERLKALGHERPPGVRARFHVGDFHLLHAGEALQRDGRRVFRGDDAGEKLAVFRFEIPRVKGRFHLGVRIHDGAEQFARAMRAHAGERGAEVHADVAVLVARRAGLGEKRPAFRRVAFALDDGQQFGDRVLLRLRERVWLGEHFGGAFGHALVGMGAEARGGGGAEFGHIDAVGLDRIEEGERPVGALEQGVKSGSLHVGGQFRVGGGKRRAHAGVVGLAERGDEAALERGRAVGGELFYQGRQDCGVAATEADEALHGTEARGIFGLGVGDGGEERTREFGSLGLERAGLVPLRGEREDAATRAAGEEFGERGGKFRRHRGRVLERLAELVEHRALQRVGAGGLGRERDDELRGGVRVVLPTDGIGELRDERRERRGIGGVKRGGDAGGGVPHGGTHGGGFLEVVVELRPRGDEGLRGIVATSAGCDGAERGESDGGISVFEKCSDFHRVVGTRTRHTSGCLQNQRGVSAHDDLLVRQSGGDLRGFQLPEPVQRPQRGDLRAGVCALEHRRDRLRAHRLRLIGSPKFLHQQSVRGHPHMRVRMLQRLRQLGGTRFRQIRHRDLLRVLVVDAPDAAKVVVAVGTYGGVDFVVVGAACVVVDDGLVVKIADKDRAVRAHADLDGPPPHVFAADELRLLAPRQFRGGVAAAFGREPLVGDDVDRRLGGEVVAVVFRRPCAAVVNRATRARREVAHAINLHVGHLLPRHRREGFLRADDGVKTPGAAHFSARQRGFRKHDLVEQRAARRLGPHHPVFARDLEAPGVAALRAVLLKGRAVRFEADDSAPDAAKALLAVGALHIAAAVTVRGVDPAVPAPARIVDDRVRVAGAEARVELLDLVALAVAVGVAEEKDVRRLRDDHAVLVENEAGNEVEALVKNRLLIHHAVAVGVREAGNFVDRLALLHAGRRVDAAVVLPLLAAVVRAHAAAAIRILRGLGDPQRTVGRPVKVHRLVDERFGGDELEREVGMNFEVLERVRRALRAPSRVGQRGEFLLLHELIEVVAFPGPRDAAQEHRAILRQVEGLEQVPGDADERAVRFRAALPRIFINPHLRLHVINLRLAAAAFAAASVGRVASGEHASLGFHVHVVVNLVVEMEIRRALRDGMPAAEELILGVVEVHRAFLPFGRAGLPRAAEHLAPPGRVFHRDRRRVQHHEAAAALEEGIDHGLLLRRGVAALLGVGHDHVGLLELIRRRPVERAVHLHPALGEQRLPLREEPRMRVDFLPAVILPRADEDAERFRLRDGGDGEEGDEGEETFHERRNWR